jgi:hypothetical protein
MYSKKVNFLSASKTVAAIFIKHPFHFIGYLIFVVGISLGLHFLKTIIIVITLGFGWILLNIPIIKYIFNLPFSTLYRLFSIEFLNQFIEVIPSNE